MTTEPNGGLYAKFAELGRAKSKTRYDAASLQLARVLADNVLDDKTSCVLAEFTEAVLALNEAYRASLAEWAQEEVTRQVAKQMSIVAKHRILAAHFARLPWRYFGMLIAAGLLGGAAGSGGVILGAMYAAKVSENGQVQCQDQPDGSVLCRWSPQSLSPTEAGPAQKTRGSN